MAKNHFFLGTDQDTGPVREWLASNSAVEFHREKTADGSGQASVLYAFPAIGEVKYWPDRIDPSVLPSGSIGWKSAILNKEVQDRKPGRRVVQSTESPIAVLFEPNFRESVAWGMGEVSFPAANLRERFPALNAVNSAFSRWLRKHELVYDYTGREPYRPYLANLLGVSNCVKVFALPQAFNLLKAGRPFVDRLISPAKFNEVVRPFRCR